MKTDIKAMLPELPSLIPAQNFVHGSRVIGLADFEAWLDKLTEGAKIKYGNKLGNVLTTVCEPDDTHRHLVIPLGEIKKQTPLEIAVDALELIATHSRKGRLAGQLGQDALQALAQIEAAKK